jgi:DHA1 family bicyclomycin/chloramphenicol resistance-like MFS transporter
MSIPLSPHSRMSSPTVVLTLMLLMGIQPVTTDLYLPALPTIARALGATMNAAQMTLAALAISFGTGQLVCGPLSDRFGRRPMLLLGLAVYTLASVLSAVAPDIAWLIGWRAVQGIGMAAVVTAGRSIIRDLYEPLDGARVMSRALTGLGILATMSPVTGGLVVTWINWHAALLVLALFGAGTLAYIAVKFEETLPVRNPQATRLGTLARNWVEIARNRTFQSFALLGAATYGGLFVFLAGSAFVFIDVLGISRAAYGVLMSSSSFAYVIGTLLCRYLLARRGLRYTVLIGSCFTLVGGVTMGALALAGVHTVWAVIVPQWIFCMGHGIHQPCGQAGAVGPFPEKAGTAASLSGFVMMLSAFLVGIWLGRAFDGTVVPMASCVAVCSVGVAAVAWTMVRQHGEVRAAPVAEAAA